MSWSPRLKFITSFTLTLAALVTASAMWVSQVSGQFGSFFMQPFGGRIVSTVYCTCDGTIWHTIGPPRPASVIYMPGRSILHDFGQIFFPPPWTLGLRAEVRECKIVTPVGCPPVGGGQVIHRTGTSLY